MNFFKEKSVFITGHTGFKGAWMCEVLKRLGANVTGFALAPESGCVFDVLNVGRGMQSFIGDVRDFDSLEKAIGAAQPEIVFHLAAQPLVLDSYKRPVYTFETNVMGTVNLLECVLAVGGVRSVVVVTTDKVYRNDEQAKGFCEDDKLGGNDPYSSSKACAELVSSSYSASFFRDSGIALSTARAGNVIGGGDIAENRIIPDCVRAARAGEAVFLRNPDAVRPYQHVLEPVFAYMQIAQRQWENPGLADSYNIGSNEQDGVTTENLVSVFCQKWGNGMKWKAALVKDAPYESGLLYLDCNKIKRALGWRPVWDIEMAVEKTVEWEKARLSGEFAGCTHRQIDEYMEGATCV